MGRKKKTKTEDNNIDNSLENMQELDNQMSELEDSVYEMDKPKEPVNNPVKSSPPSNMGGYKFINSGTLQIGNHIYTDEDLENQKTINTLKKILGDNFKKYING